MNKRYYVNLFVAVIVFSAVLYGAQNCGNFQPIQGGAPLMAGTETSINGKTYTQIERLGRPGVNEGLVINNDKLIAFNSIDPTLDLATGNAAVLSVLQEASAVLDVVDSLEGANNFGDGFASEVVAGFLPDVMRIDTEANIPPPTAAYNGAAEGVTGNTTGAIILTGGRKLEDDVIDITLTYLVTRDPGGAIIKDNVTYQGVAGNPAQGHKKLHGQASYGGAATFPFLASPN